jgi:hypothetical protein
MFYDININTTDIADIQLIIEEKLKSCLVINPNTNYECYFRYNQEDEWIYYLMCDFHEEVISYILEQKAHDADAYAKRKYIIDCHNKTIDNMIHHDYDLYVSNLEKYEEILNRLERSAEYLDKGEEGDDEADEQSSDEAEKHKDDQSSDEDSEDEDQHMMQSNQCILS